MDLTEIQLDIKHIIEQGFNEYGLNKLEEYAEQFNERKILYKRFSPQEQYGCRTGGITHVIASLLTGTEIATSGISEESIPDFKTELKLSEKQILLNRTLMDKPVNSEILQEKNQIFGY